MADMFNGLPEPEASSQNGFATRLIEPRSESRPADSVAAALSEATSRLYLFRGESVLFKPRHVPDPLFTPDEAADLGMAPETAILLGWTDDGQRLAAVAPESDTVDAVTLAATDLRSLATAGEIEAHHLGALAQARSLCNWHQRHGFCAACGAQTTMRAGGYRRDCPACGASHFPRTDPVVIMLAVDHDRCVLGRQARFIPGMYSCLAGFLEPGETIEDAVRRETREESGIRVGRVRYYASQPWPFPSSLMIGCHAEALSRTIIPDEEELEDCRWFERAEVAAMLAGTHAGGLQTPPPMAIAHRIIRAWVES